MSHPPAFLSGVNRELSAANHQYGGSGQKVALLKTVARQYGAIARSQILELGLSPRYIDRCLTSGEWQKLYKEVYRVSSVPTSWHQELMAAYLWSGGKAVVSHRAAAILWGLAGIDAGFVELSLPVFRRPPSSRVILHCTGTLPKCDVTARGAFPLTDVSRTLIDLAAVADEESVEAALDDALRRRITSLTRIRWRFKELGVRGRPGVAMIRTLLKDRDSRAKSAESALEMRLLRLLRASGLPEPERQYEIRERGRVIARIDFAYPKALVAIEADGYRYHSGRSVWQKDLERRNALTVRGWRVLHVTWDDIASRPNEVMEKVRQALTMAKGMPNGE